MRALVVRQPYANQIANGSKTVEHRSWSTQYRGPILIVAGQNRSEQGTEPPYGVTVCIVELGSVSGNIGAYCWHLWAPLPVRHRPIRGRLGLWKVQQ